MFIDESADKSTKTRKEFDNEIICLIGREARTFAVMRGSDRPAANAII